MLLYPVPPLAPPTGWGRHTLSAVGNARGILMADEGITITLDGEEFAVEDFEGRELVDAERAFGISLFAELERGSVTGIYAMLYLIKKRSNPRFTADDAMALSLGDVTKMLATPENGTAGGPPSDRAGGRRAKKSPAATAGNQPS